MTKPGPKVPRERVLQTAASVPTPGGARREVTRSIAAAESGSKQHVLAEAWLNEGGAVGDPAQLNPLRILVVENDAMIATLIAETLEAMGHEVCAIATTQEDAVTATALHRPDLLLVDVHLQAGSGTGAVAEILREGPVPHIFMTGDQLSAGSESGTITLRKPFQDHHLAEAIRLAFAGGGVLEHGGENRVRAVVARLADCRGAAGHLWPYLGQRPHYRDRRGLPVVALLALLKRGVPEEGDGGP